MSSRKRLAALVGAAAFAAAVNLVSPGVALAGVWNSAGEADWSTAANWDTGIAPATGWDAVPGAGAPTLASGTALFGGPAFIVYHAPLTLDGGSLRMTAGVGSNVFVGWGGANSKATVNAGSTFDFWQMFVGADSAPDVPNPAYAGLLSVNGGNLLGDAIIINDNSTMNIASGSVTLTDIFHVRSGSLAMSGGTLTADGIGFDGAGTRISLSGGRINLEWGIFIASDGYVDFLEASTGVIHLAGDTAGAEAANMLSAGKVRYMGVTDVPAFGITVDASGSYISAVPEPTSSVIAVVALASLSTRRRRRE